MEGDGGEEIKEWKGWRRWWDGMRRLGGGGEDEEGSGMRRKDLRRCRSG